MIMIPTKDDLIYEVCTTLGRSEDDAVCTKPTGKCSFISVLKRFGFKSDGNRGNDVKCYVTKDGKRYAEILKYSGWSEVWVVGNNIPCNSTMSYPGGSRFSEPVKLLECLVDLKYKCSEMLPQPLLRKTHWYRFGKG